MDDMDIINPRKKKLGPQEARVKIAGRPVEIVFYEKNPSFVTQA